MTSLAQRPDTADTIYGLSVYLSGLTNKPRQTEASKKKRAKGKKKRTKSGKGPRGKFLSSFSTRRKGIGNVGKVDRCREKRIEITSLVVLEVLNS